MKKDETRLHADRLQQPVKVEMAKNEPDTRFTMTDFLTVPAAKEVVSNKNINSIETFLREKRLQFLREEYSDNKYKPKSSVLTKDVLKYLQFLSEYSEKHAEVKVKSHMEPFTPANKEHIEKDGMLRFKSKAEIGWVRSTISKVRTQSVITDIETLEQRNSGDAEFLANTGALKDIIKNSALSRFKT